MKNRLEYKYLVPNIYLDKLRNDLVKYLDHDDYALKEPDNQYTVRSVYLDSFDYKCYREKLDGIHTRRKFRVRVYNNYFENTPAFLEIKRKYNNFISKDRAKIEFAQLVKALSDEHVNIDFKKEEKDFRNFYYYFQSKYLEPKVLVVYEREPFQCKFGSQLRITFDTNLRTRTVSDFDSIFDETGLKTVFKREFIFEIKFFQVLPEWIDMVLRKYNLTRIAVSKYTSCIDAAPVSTLVLNKLTRSYC